MTTFHFDLMNPLHQTQDGKCDEFVRQSQETLDGIFKPIQDLQEQQREGWVSDTPETDLEEAIQTQRFGGYMVKSDFARKLERERDEAREALAVHKAITTYSLDQSLADREANEQHCAMMEKALSETRP